MSLFSVLSYFDINAIIIDFKYYTFMDFKDKVTMKFISDFLYKNAEVYISIYIHL